MKLVGASNFIIRTPFLISGFLQGLSGSLLAVICTRLLIKLINQYLAGDLIRLQSEISIIITLKIILFGIFLGIVGSWLSVSRYLSRY
jgi:cell division transport system permease protein